MDQAGAKGGPGGLAPLINKLTLLKIAAIVLNLVPLDPSKSTALPPAL